MPSVLNTPVELRIAMTAHSLIYAPLYRAATRLCKADNGLLPRHLVGCIFATFQAPEFSFLLPQMPTLFMYPRPEGRLGRPWFSDGGAG